MPELAMDRVKVARGGMTLLDGVSLAIRSGEFVALLGPNGAGKTTLLRAGLGMVALDSGAARLDGVDVARLPPRARARKVAYLPQARPLAWPLSVRDAVALGRFAHGVSRLAGEDARAVEGALAACDLVALAGRRSDTLSGGELARVHIARALAAEAPLLVADEPTAGLDPLHAWKAMSLIARFVAGGGGALVVAHDLALAARFSTRVAVLRGGVLVADGPPAAVLQPELIAEVFGVRAVFAEIEGALAFGYSGPA